jgi:hypothetical protein
MENQNNQLTNLDARYRCFLNSTAGGGEFTDGKIQVFILVSFVRF